MTAEANGQQWISWSSIPILQTCEITLHISTQYLESFGDITSSLLSVCGPSWVRFLFNVQCSSAWGTVLFNVLCGDVTRIETTTHKNGDHWAQPEPCWNSSHCHANVWTFEHIAHTHRQPITIYLSRVLYSPSFQHSINQKRKNRVKSLLVRNFRPTNNDLFI